MCHGIWHNLPQKTGALIIGTLLLLQNWHFLEEKPGIGDVHFSGVFLENGFELCIFKYVCFTFYTVCQENTVIVFDRVLHCVYTKLCGVVFVITAEML